MRTGIVVAGLVAVSVLGISAPAFADYNAPTVSKVADPATCPTGSTLSGTACTITAVTDAGSAFTFTSPAGRSTIGIAVNLNTTAGREFFVKIDAGAYQRFVVATAKGVVNSVVLTTDLPTIAGGAHTATFRASTATAADQVSVDFVQLMTETIAALPTLDTRITNMTVPVSGSVGVTGSVDVSDRANRVNGTVDVLDRVNRVNGTVDVTDRAGRVNGAGTLNGPVSVVNNGTTSLRVTETSPVTPAPASSNTANVEPYDANILTSQKSLDRLAQNSVGIGALTLFSLGSMLVLLFRRAF